LFLANGRGGGGFCGTTAYVLDLDVFGGKKSENSSPYNAVMSLMDGYLDKHHMVVMDNHFTSVPLMVDLLERSTYACGTVRLNRKYLPDEFKIKKDATWRKSLAK
jgi:hypothetical protein